MKTFVINLKERSDRLENINELLHRLDMPYIVFPAVNAKSLSRDYIVQVTDPEALEKLKTSETRSSHAELTSLGAIGCYLSHYFIWEMVAKGKEPVLILEDDSIPAIKEVKEYLSFALEELSSSQVEFDVLLLGSVYSKLKKNEAGNYVTPVKKFMGTHSYVLTPQGAAKILQGALPLKIQVDGYMSDSIASKGLLVYHTNTHLFNQSQLFNTDIQFLGCTNCEHYMTTKLDITFYILFYIMMILVIINSIHSK